MSADPLYVEAPESAGLVPRNLNSFAYVLGDPYAFVDPSGLESFGVGRSPFWQIVAHAQKRVFDVGNQVVEAVLDPIGTLSGAAENVASDVHKDPTGERRLLEANAAAAEWAEEAVQAVETGDYPAIGEKVGDILTVGGAAAVGRVFGGGGRRIVRRFDTAKNIKRMKKHGAQFDPDKGSGIPATSTDIEPVDPDRIRKATGARSAESYVDIDITGKKTIERKTKAGRTETVLQDDISPEDIVDSGRVRKSVQSPD